MKKKSLIILLIILALAVLDSKSGEQHIGLTIGSPTGLVGGLRLKQTIYELNLGVSGNDFMTTFDKLSAKSIYTLGFKKWEFPVHLGWGIKFRNSFHPQLGLRGVIRMSYLMERYDLETFMQLAPAFRMTPSYGINVDFVIGTKIRFDTLLDILSKSKD